MHYPTPKVYFCRHIAHGIRFYFLVREGLLQHPRVQLVSSPAQADVVIYLPESMKWERSECGKPELFPKMVVLDEGDHPELFVPPVPGTVLPKAPNRWNLLYFKRSFVRRRAGEFRSYMNYLKTGSVLPMTYTIADAYVRPQFLPLAQRNHEILCTLRGSNRDPARLRVQTWVREYAKSRGIQKFTSGAVNHASRPTISRGYFTAMQTSKIIVTANPSGWEGDFRFMESLASAALVFVDRMYVPRPYPLHNNHHLVYFENTNKTELFERLDFYRQNLARAQEVALNGYLHTLKKHRAANLLDYVLVALDIKLSAVRQGEVPLDVRPEALLAHQKGYHQTA